MNNINVKKEDKKEKIIEVVRSSGVFEVDGRKINYDNAVLIVSTVIDGIAVAVDCKNYKLKYSDLQSVTGYTSEQLIGKFIKDAYFDKFGRLNRIAYAI